MLGDGFLVRYTHETTSGERKALALSETQLAPVQGHHHGGQVPV